MKIPRVEEVKKRNKTFEKPKRLRAHLTFMYRTHKEICPLKCRFHGVPMHLSAECGQQVGLEAARLSKTNRLCVISRVEVRSALAELRRGQIATEPHSF